jgi:hypothetical protein
VKRNALGGQAVDIRRFIKGLGIIGADVHEAQVIGEKKHHIGFKVFDGE